MDAQLSVLKRELAGFGIDLFGPGGRQDLFQLLSDRDACSVMSSTPFLGRLRRGHEHHRGGSATLFSPVSPLRIVKAR